MFLCSERRLTVVLAVSHKYRRQRFRVDGNHLFLVILAAYTFLDLPLQHGSTRCCSTKEVVIQQRPPGVQLEATHELLGHISCKKLTSR